MVNNIQKGFMIPWKSSIPPRRHFSNYRMKPEDATFVEDDLKDGYFHGRIRKKSQTFLGIQWKKDYFVFQVIPFGLAISPFWFTKMMRPVVKAFREKKIKTVSYVDDFLFILNKDHQRKKREDSEDLSEIRTAIEQREVGPNTVSQDRVPWIEDRFSSEIQFIEKMPRDGGDRCIPAMLEDVNPPFALLPRVLNLLKNQGPLEATIIAPYWPAQPWWKDLYNIADSILEIPNKRDTFLPDFPEQCGTPQEPTMEDFSIQSNSGSRKQKTGIPRRRSCCCRLKDLPPLRPTTRSLKNAKNSVHNIKFHSHLILPLV
jgi:hypothetical protein